MFLHRFLHIESDLTSLWHPLPHFGTLLSPIGLPLLPFASPLLPFGSLWDPFWFPFVPFWHPFGSHLASIWFPLVPFGSMLFDSYHVCFHLLSIYSLSCSCLVVCFSVHCFVVGFHLLVFVWVFVSGFMIVALVCSPARARVRYHCC